MRYLIIAILLISVVTAYVQPIKHNEVDIKFYNENINKTKVFKQLDSIPEKYFSELKYIKFFSYSPPVVAGIYFPYNGVVVFDCKDDCFHDTIIHELAHHQQLLNKEPLYNLIAHKGNFCYYYENIRNASTPNTYYIQRYCQSENS